MKISKTIRDLTSFNQICLQSWKLSQILMVITIMLVKALCVRYIEADDSYGDGALYSHALLIFGIFYMTQVFYFIGIIVEKLYSIS